MPLYEYKCGLCGQVFERIQKFSDEPVKLHDGCGGAVERLVSTSALMFKGSGWYITDYKKSSSGSSKDAQARSSEGKSGEGKGGDSKSGDSKNGETKAKTEASPAPVASTSSTSGSTGDSKK